MVLLTYGIYNTNVYDFYRKKIINKIMRLLVCKFIALSLHSRCFRHLNNMLVVT